ncbi:MAG: sodium/proline symporter [Hydrogenovibrio sp.]
MILYTFLFFLSLFFFIGVASYFFSRKTTEDYLVAGKSVHPALVGLSAVATNNSGFMFIGMIGATYFMGLSSIWLMVGWIFGDWLVQRQAVKAIQTQAQNDEVHSFGGLILHWMKAPSAHRLRQLIGLLTILFLTIYAAAQLKAGTKATEALLDWPRETGILLAAAIIFVYSLVGGLRASIWTDVAQSVVMLGGMLLMVYFGVVSLGSFGDINHLLHEVSSDYMFWFPSDLNVFSAILFIIGWVFGGMGVIGQPHVVIRFMTLHPDRTPREMQFYYYGWFTVFYGLTIIVGLLSRLLIPSTDNFDAEMALPLLADQLMPDMFAGLMLAALFAATMSTVDSLILSCSASLTRDLRNTPTNSLMLTKLATFTILVVAVSIALSNNQTVFSLVLDAWGLLGSAFGPLIIWLALKQRINQAWAILTILVGMLSFTLISYFGWLSFVYTITFGFLFGLGTALLGSRFIPVAANKNPG